ncbi:MAG: peptide chain release factor N(5)-glutamine methyltransferase [Verrucomicrobiae bacterium]|nr:peptide chain release factor N(5)-glutamine methyltransferase [Verrucomicrobiae bacterium]
MTVLEAISKSADFLGKKGVESPRLNAELLLAHLLKLPRMKLYLNFERALTAGETDGLRELVKRRGMREPLQHITGSTSFCGCEIAVSRSALVPRPETELLAELGWQFLTERRAPARLEASGLPQRAELELGAPTAVDFGTGTGCIAIALAVKCPGAQITALEVSAEALALARQNAELNKVAGRIEFLAGDGFATLAAKTGLDLIISNPPYIASAEIETLEPEVRDFDPRAALDGGADGLDFYRRLAAAEAACLKPDGKIMVEFGDGQAAAIKKIFEGEKWIVERVQEDYSHRSRILVARLVDF